MPKVLLATPCYGGLLHRGYFHSILNLISECAKEGIEIFCSTMGNESLITRGRNFFCAQLLSDKNFTHLFFIDADISFDTLSFIRMVKSEFPITVGAYPKKAINYDKMIEIAKSGDIDNIIERSQDYAINIIAQNNPIKNGFLKILYGATGYMCIQRQVIECMIEKNPQWQYFDDVHQWKDDDIMKQNFYAIFDCFICPTTKRYLSEDYAFIQRAKELGYECWLDLTFVCEHSGTHAFRGAYYHQIKHLIEPPKEEEKTKEK